jgi:hypothetical protein
VRHDASQIEIRRLFLALLLFLDLGFPYGFVGEDLIDAELHRRENVSNGFKERPSEDVYESDLRFAHLGDAVEDWRTTKQA